MSGGIDSVRNQSSPITSQYWYITRVLQCGTITGFNCAAVECWAIMQANQVVSQVGKAIGKLFFNLLPLAPNVNKRHVSFRTHCASSHVSNDPQSGVGESHRL